MPVAGAGQRPVFFLLHYPLMAVVKLDTKEVTTGKIMLCGVQILPGGDGLQGGEGRNDQGQEVEVEGFWGRCTTSWTSS